jgi:hypothetical protein
VPSLLAILCPRQPCGKKFGLRPQGWREFGRFLRRTHVRAPKVFRKALDLCRQRFLQGLKSFWDFSRWQVREGLELVQSQPQLRVFCVISFQIEFGQMAVQILAQVEGATLVLFDLEMFFRRAVIAASSKSVMGNSGRNLVFSSLTSSTMVLKMRS